MSKFTYLCSYVLFNWQFNGNQKVFCFWLQSETQSDYLNYTSSLFCLKQTFIVIIWEEDNI